MKRIGNLLSAMACFGCIAAAGPVLAQKGAPVPGDGDSPIKFGSGFMRERPAANSPGVKVQPQAWPRLDPGATICRSETDLDRLAARRRGDAVNGPVDCQIVRTATPIDILRRKGPGRTEVHIQAPGAAIQNGWTDAWLPEKAPVNAAR
jgi:hypothetical protein